MIIYADAALRIQFDAELSLLRTAWVPGAPVARYRPACDELLRVAQDCDARNYLVDMSDVPDISLYDQLWLSRHWVPAALGLFTERVVYCNQAARVHNQLAIESLLYLARPLIRCDVQFFSEADAAMAWLSDYSPRLPALLAEWTQTFGPSPDSGPDPIADELAEPDAPYYPISRS